MPQVHVLGEVVGGSGYDRPSAFCIWRLVKDDHYWSVVRGADNGQTQQAMEQRTCAGVDVLWAHPIDIHLATSSIRGWPKITLEVWHETADGRKELCGYGTCRIPTTTGCITIECPTWRPIGNASSWTDRLSTYFFGAPWLVNPNVVHDGPPNQYDLCTETTGCVVLEFQLLLSGWTRQTQFSC
ncbi:B9 domain-containing protein 2-like [Achlya hypogyna]|uniref:B9 domain-containing protein 2 n=1 Tax=Achlya hypogyna TaxID=1202772 RepID=A0A1V9YI31_ACHHY|nr:B9 domain-containing protein 2-like [Achlya hypogyna]